MILIVLQMLPLSIFCVRINFIIMPYRSYGIEDPRRSKTWSVFRSPGLIMLCCCCFYIVRANVEAFLDASDLYLSNKSSSVF